MLARAGSPPPSVPHIVGYLAAGTIVEVGAGVENRAAGDRVVTLNMAGSNASKRAVPAVSTWLIPDGLDAAAAACVPVAMGTAQECLFTAGNLEAGQAALIHAGAGGVGMAAIQLAKHAGATVISTASSDEKLERLNGFGLDHGINYAGENFVERTRELTDGRGVDVILDSVGGQTLVDSIGALAYHGTGHVARIRGREQPAGSRVACRSLLVFVHPSSETTVSERVRRVLHSSRSSRLDLRSYSSSTADAVGTFVLPAGRFRRGREHQGRLVPRASASRCAGSLDVPSFWRSASNDACRRRDHVRVSASCVIASVDAA